MEDEAGFDMLWEVARTWMHRAIRAEAELRKRGIAVPQDSKLGGTEALAKKELPQIAEPTTK